MEGERGVSGCPRLLSAGAHVPQGEKSLSKSLVLEKRESALSSIITSRVLFCSQALSVLNCDAHCKHLIKGDVHLRQRQRMSE